MLCSVPYTYTMHLTYHQVHWCHTLYLIPLPYTYHILCSLQSPWWTSPSSLKSRSVPHTSTIHLSHFVFTTNTMVNITKFTVVALCTVYLYHAAITFLCSSQSPWWTSPPLSLMLCSVPYTSAMHLSQFAIQSLSLQFIHGWSELFPDLHLSHSAIRVSTHVPVSPHQARLYILYTSCNL